MKIIKFRSNLVPLVLSGEKNSTWRLFDDKDLTIGDSIELKNWETGETFGTAKISRVVEKPFAELTPEDKFGHEVFQTDEEMYRTYSHYYQQPVGPDSTVKILWFNELQETKKSTQ